ncbi:MAG: PEP-CTERM sorting domain-containing protein [Phycisphaerae bacterium]|jgi:T5SS/PEP-CTERM-associated repeat protein
MKRSIFAAVCVALFAATTFGDIIETGSVHWDSASIVYIGYDDDGSIVINDDSDLVGMANAYLGRTTSPITAELTVTGAGSTYSGGVLQVSYYSFTHGVLNVTDGGSVAIASAVFGAGTGTDTTVNITGGGTVTATGAVNIGRERNCTTNVLVSGAGSLLDTPTRFMIVGSTTATDTVLTVENGGLVRARSLYVYGNNYIRVGLGGMVAMLGDVDNYDDFAALMGGDETMYYWSSSANDWANLADATLGVDYTLTVDGGFTTLTVVPEPTTLGLLLAAGLALLRRR